MKTNFTQSEPHFSFEDEKRTVKQKVVFAIEVIVLSILLFATVNSFGQAPAVATAPGITTASTGSGELNLVKQSVVYNSGKIYMNWIAPSNSIDCIYVVERSTDGAEYEPVGLKEGIGSPLELLYSWVDQKPAQGTAQYRIKQISTEGKLIAQGTANTISTPVAGPVREDNAFRSASTK